MHAGGIAGAATLVAVFGAQAQCDPDPAATVAGAYIGVVASGDIAYVVDQEALTTIAVIEPALPHPLGTVATPYHNSYRREVHVDRAIAYVSTAGGIEMIDVSDPVAPRSVGRLQISGLGFTVSGDSLCVQVQDHVRVFDVSDPSAPVLASLLPSGRQEFALGADDGLLALFADDRLKLVDVRSPGAVKELGSLQLPLILVRDIKVHRRLVYVVSFLYDLTGVYFYQLHTVDVSDPSTPTVLWNGLIGFEYPWIAVDNGMIFSMFSRSVAAFDARDPTAPKLLGSMAYGVIRPAAMAAQNHVHFVVPSGDALQIRDYRDCLPCYADCDTSTGVGTLDVFDFLCFQDKFALGNRYACDCDTSTGYGVCDVFDFLCFHDAFVAGCP
jgi:hypothetical protein